VTKLVLLLTAAVVVGALPASASAAIQVQVQGGVLTVQGSAAGEVLNVNGPLPASPNFPGIPGYRVDDNTGRGQLVAGPGCTFNAGSTSPNDYVQCDEAGVTRISIDAGAGGDEVNIGNFRTTSLPVPVTARGGPQDDVLLGGDEPVPGDPTRITLLGDDGDDFLSLVGSGTANGGAGNDRFGFSRVESIGVGLPAGTVTVGIGGTGNDTFSLFRSSASDNIDAGPGADRIDARAGVSGPGDVVDCGAGRDEYLADPADQLTACEVSVPVPVTGKTVSVSVVRGVVTARRPGRSAITLGEGVQIPVGSIVDTTRGTVSLTAAGTGGGLESAVFFDGEFQVTQSRSRRPVTTLTLVEPLAPCRGSTRTVRAAAAGKKRPRSRKLWGDGKGAFRTRGRRSAAIVSGTRWLVQDSCAGTLTRVTRGTVTVEDFRKRKTVVVRAGGRYLAK
jgi:hypothetical protein